LALAARAREGRAGARRCTATSPPRTTAAWMQKLLYKYLPEPMQNPQTFEWMLSNPQYRKQLEDIMQQQARAPAPSRTSAGSACMRVGLLSAGVP